MNKTSKSNSHIQLPNDNMRLHEKIAAYAEKHAGTSHDLDVAFENAALKQLAEDWKKECGTLAALDIRR